MTKVNVLLSSYNGEKYINKQIDSILQQEGVEIDLLVRDDGSKDDTINILQDYHKLGKLEWYQGLNLKPAKSFLQLLKDSHDTEYYAFADQDDYWQSEKLKMATNKLDKFRSVPALYFSRTELVNKELEHIKTPLIQPYLTFGESLVYEFIPGCTIVLNKELRNIINSYTPTYLPMHDVWIYSIAQAIGAKIIFDEKAYIKYRQHENNTIGQGKGYLHETKRRFHRFINKESSRYRRAIELKKGYNTLITQENKDILNLFISGKKNISDRWKIMNDKRFLCENQNTYRFFQLALLLNTY